MKNGAEVDVVRAIACGAEGRAERVARNADEKVEAVAGLLFEAGAETASFGNGKTVFAEVNAAGTRGESYINAVVDKNAGARRAGSHGVQRGTRKIEGFPAA